MIAAVDQELYFVGENLTKEDAYVSKRDGRLRRITQGVYIPSDRDISDAFRRYALRICWKRYPDVALTHATARLKAPSGDQHALRVFIGGDYPHKAPFRGVNHQGELEECFIVQTAVWPGIGLPEPVDPLLYERVTLSDDLGSFEMWCSTLELQVLQQMDATKVHPEKHLSDATLEEMWRELQDKHGGATRAWNAVKEVSKRGKKSKKLEAQRFGNRFHQDILRDLPLDEIALAMRDVLDISRMSRDDLLRTIVLMDDTTRNKVLRVIMMRDLIDEAEFKELIASLSEQFSRAAV